MATLSQKWNQLFPKPATAAARSLFRRAGAILLLFVVSARVAQAQNPPAKPAQPAQPQAQSTAQALAPTFLAVCSADPVLKYLTAAYHKGDWPTFQSEARTLLDALRRDPPKSQDDKISAGSLPAACTREGSLEPPAPGLPPLPSAAIEALDYRTRYVALVWIGKSPLGETQVLRALVHLPAPEPYSTDLPGVNGFTEVFLASSPNARSVSLYTSTREDDPFVEQLPEVIKAIFNPLSTTVAGILGAKRGPAPETISASRLAVTISGVVLPIRRASVRAQINTKDLAQPESFQDAVSALGIKLLFDEPGRSAVTRKQVETLMTDLPRTATDFCGPPPSTSGERAATSSETCRKQILDLLRDRFNTAITTEGATDRDKQLAATVDTQFRTVALDALSTSAELDTTFRNRPLTRFTFGAGAAVIAHAHLNQVRTKIDDDSGLLVSDPLPRVMTMAFVNWSPRGYDGEKARISTPERVRPFFGAALTPDFGIIGGANVLLTRGIGVVGGIGWLFGKGATAEEIGQPPAASEDPFKLAVSRSLFIGISYNYK